MSRVIARHASTALVGRLLVSRHAARVLIARSSDLQSSIQVAQEKFSRDDRVGALREFEKAANDNNSLEEQILLLYNMTAVHASMGDVELAQIPLRQALALGLDFEAALANPQPGMIPWKSSQQVIISLRRFCKTMKSSVKAKSLLVPGGPTRGLDLSPKGIRDAVAMDDVSDLLGAELKGIDTSMLGVAKRVGLLLLGLTGLGFALFWLGLQYMFPQ